MMSIKKILAVTLLFIPLFFVPVAKAQESGYYPPPVDVMPKSVAADYFTAGGSVTVSNAIAGDAYVAGGTVIIDGTVSGDLLVAGGTVTIDGTVDGNIRVAGGTVIINGTVGKNITVVSGSVNINKKASVAGNINVLSGTMIFLGNTSGNIHVIGGEASVDGYVGGDVDAKVQNLKFGDSATVAGSLSYESPQQASMGTNTKIMGNVMYVPMEKQMPQRQSGEKVHTGVEIISLITSFIIGFIIIRLFPKRTLQITEVLQKRFWVSMGVGFLAIVISPFAVILLLVSVVGIPLAFLWVVALLILAYMAKIWVAFAVGRALVKRAGSGERRGWALLAGLLLYYVVGYIPVIGGLTKLIVMLIGIGAVLIEKKQFYKELSAKKLV